MKYIYLSCYPGPSNLPNSFSQSSIGARRNKTLRSLVIAAGFITRGHQSEENTNKTDDSYTRSDLLKGIQVADIRRISCYDIILSPPQRIKKEAFLNLVVLDTEDALLTRSLPPGMFVINPSPRPTTVEASNRIAPNRGSPQIWAWNVKFGSCSKPGLAFLGSSFSVRGSAGVSS